MLRIRQVPSATWPSGDARPLAVLAEEPAELTELVFDPTVDDLGEAVISVVETWDGLQFGFLRYHDSPTPGIAIYVVSDEDRMPQALEALEDALDTTRDRFRWISPAANAPG
jgi:hypothetical protein